MKIDGDDVKFRTGRTEYANRGIVGISVDEDGELSLSEGYDGGFPAFDDPLTKEEREELAAYMIDRWAKFGTKEVAN